MQQLFSILQQVDSTNNYAMAAIRNGTAIDGSCWFARHQTNGKGQRGKTWANKANENIAMSIVLKPRPYFAHNLFILNALVSVAVREFCQTITGNKNFRIKWPNDIYCDDKKAAGILIETVIADSIVTHCIVGIGLNVNQESFGQELAKAVSLKIISGTSYIPEDLGKLLYDQIMLDLVSCDADQLMLKYNNELFKKNEEVKLRQANASFKTKIHSVTNFGQLITKDVLERQFNFGEVSWDI